MLTITTILFYTAMIKILKTDNWIIYLLENFLLPSKINQSYTGNKGKFDNVATIKANYPT